MESRRKREAARQAGLRRANKREYSEALIDQAVAAGYCMVTLTFAGAPPAFAEWRPRFHRIARRMRRLGIATHVIAIPHSMPGVRGDIHLLMNMHSAAVTRLAPQRGLNAKWNKARTKLAPANVALRDLTVEAGFGEIVDWTDIDGFAASYLLRPTRWDQKSIWQSGSIK